MARRDKYGFPKNTHPAYHQFEAEYEFVQLERKRRWSQLLLTGKDGTIAYPKHDDTRFQRFVRKGVPQNLRPQVWMHYSGAKELMRCNPAVYNQMLERIVDQSVDLSKVTRGVKYEVKQVFLSNANFHPHDSATPPASPMSPHARSRGGGDRKQRHERNRDKLTRIMLAWHCYSGEDHNTLPARPLYSIVALMLIAMSHHPQQKTLDVEQCVFWLLVAMVQQIMPPGMYDVQHGMETAATEQNLLWQLMGQHGNFVPQPSLTLGWFSSLYVDVLPVETVLRVWDQLMCEYRSKSTKIMFKVAIALFQIHDKQDLSIADFRASVANVFDCHSFMAYANKIKLTVATVQSYRHRAIFTPPHQDSIGCQVVREWINKQQESDLWLSAPQLPRKHQMQSPREDSRQVSVQMMQGKKHGEISSFYQM